MDTSSADEPPRKGRSNAILTYETVEGINLGIQEALMKIDHLNEKLTSMGGQYMDHEVRIRALELTVAGSTASRGTSAWLWQAIWPVAAVLISALNYLR